MTATVHDDSSGSTAPPSERTATFLEGDLCIGNTQALHTTLLETLMSTGGAILDLSKVSRIDTAGLQLLVAFCADLRRDGREPRLVNAPESVRTTAAIAGLFTHLGWNDVPGAAS